MKDLVEAFQIFAKYTDARNPTHCEHDVLAVNVVHKKDVSPEDHARLDELGFDWSDEDEMYKSFRFGSN